MNIAAADMTKALIAFDTTSRGSNLALIDFAQGLIEQAGGRCRRSYDVTGAKANLFATFGPDGDGGIVLSEFATTWPDLENVLGRATKDGAAIGEGHGRDILGHPFHSVAWLATQLASRGVGLKAGQVVMTGSVMKTIFPNENANYRFELADIGSVEVRVG